MKRMVWMLGLMALLMPGQAAACGPDTDCVLAERTYRISMPDGHQGQPIGALIYAHGYRGSAKAAMRNKALRALAHEQGFALVAVKSASDDWLIPGVPENPAATGEAEFGYFDALIDDLEARHQIDRTRLVATGFSAGGMMVWNLACHMGGSFAAFIPISGTYWDPVPETCPSKPVHLIHIHGTADKIVPLEGRAIKQTRQGHVLVAIDRLVEAGDYDHDVQESQSGDLNCKVGHNPDARIMGFCTHPGGHSLKMDYLRTALGILREGGAF